MGVTFKELYKSVDCCLGDFLMIDKWENNDYVKVFEGHSYEVDLSEEYTNLYIKSMMVHNNKLYIQLEK